MQEISPNVKRTLHEASTEAIQSELKERGLGIYPLNLPFHSSPDAIPTKSAKEKSKTWTLPEVRKDLQIEHSDSSNNG